MAISKRLRFEIFRRDNFQCRHCGAKPPETGRRPDHVVPEALGGRSEPSNLVTSCEPCNSGKTSIAPDSPLVEDVRQDALRWAQAIEQANEIRQAAREAWGQYYAAFLDDWEAWEAGGQQVPLDPDVEQTISRFYGASLSRYEMGDAVRAAMSARGVLPENRFRYFAGICWRKVGELHDQARSIVETLPGAGN